MHSLTPNDDKCLQTLIDEEIVRAREQGSSWDGLLEVEIDPPFCVNVIPKNSSQAKAALVARGACFNKDDDANEQIIVPILIEYPDKKKYFILKFNPRSVWAANHGIPKELLLRTFPVSLGFSNTDFKFQGATKNMIIPCLPPRNFMPHVTMSTVYMLSSRVRRGKDMFFLGLTKPWHKDHLRKLRHPLALKIWQNSYDDQGMWSAKLAIDAANAEVAKLDGVNKSPKGRKTQKRKVGYGDDDKQCELICIVSNLHSLNFT